MSIDFTNNIPVNSFTENSQNRGTSNPENLKQTFAQAIRLFVAEQQKNSSSVLLETIDIAQQSSSEHRQEQNARDQSEQQTKLNENKQLQNQRLNQSEIRHSQIKNDYVQKNDQREQIQNDYQTKIKQQKAEQIHFNSSAFPDEMKSSFDSFSTVSTIISPTISSPAISILTPSFDQSFTVTNPANTNTISSPLSPQIPVAVPTSIRLVDSPMTAQGIENLSGNMVTIPSAETSPAMETSLHNMLTNVSVMTIFTATGRLGILKNDEKEQNVTEKKKERKSFASLLSETINEKEQNQKENKELNRDQELNDPVQKIGKKSKKIEEEFSSNELSTQKFSTQQFSEQNSEKQNLFEQKQNNIKIFFEQQIFEQQKPEKADETILEILQQLPEFVSPPNFPKSVAKSPETTRLIARVAAACQSAANQNGMIRMKLNLDDWGAVTLRMKAIQKRITVFFTTETSETARLIQDNIDELKTILAQQNMILEHAEISVQ